MVCILMHIGKWENLNGIELEVEHVSLIDNVLG